MVLIMYHYEANNKFPHLILIPIDMDYTRTRHKERIAWLKENVGAIRTDWVTTSAGIYRGQKLYWNDHRYVPIQEIYREMIHAHQYAFKDTDSAMRFKLMWR